MVPDRLADVSDWWFHLACECEVLTFPVAMVIHAFGADRSPVAAASCWRCATCRQRPREAALLCDESGAGAPDPERARRIPIPLVQ